MHSVARSARRGRDRARSVRSLFVRSHLRAAAPDAATPGGRACARDRGSRRASFALSAHHRARRRRSRRCMRPASSSRRTRTPRARSTTSRRRSAPRRPSGLRDLQPRAAGRRMPAQSRLLAAHEYAGIGPGAHGRLDIDGARHATATEKRPEAWLDARRGDGHGVISDELSRARRWPTSFC